MVAPTAVSLASSRAGSQIAARDADGPVRESGETEGTTPITQLVLRWRRGEHAALDELLPHVYAELRQLAHRSMRRERTGHTLQTTALVHETYLRLVKGAPPTIDDRQHFFRLMARLMRHVLVDHARAAGAARRMQSNGRSSLTVDSVPAEERSLTDMLEIDQALDALREFDERKATVIELRYFGGLEVKEIAELLAVSIPTVVNDTRMARAWLHARVRR